MLFYVARIDLLPVFNKPEMCFNESVLSPQLKASLNLPIKDTLLGPKCSLSYNCKYIFDLLGEDNLSIKGQKQLVPKCPLLKLVGHFLIQTQEIHATHVLPECTAVSVCSDCTSPCIVFLHLAC